MTSRSAFRVAPIAAAIALLGSACSMRVTGVVRDATSAQPIGGAVVTAVDGRNRLCVTDPNGQFAVKTSWRRSNLTFGAPGYTTQTIQVDGKDRYPVIAVDLQRAFPTTAGGAPLVGAADAAGSGTAARLRELEDLRDRGLISDQEYQRTRKKIMEGM
jgi:hypothetical protein